MPEAPSLVNWPWSKAAIVKEDGMRLLLQQIDGDSEVVLTDLTLDSDPYASPFALNDLDNEASGGPPLEERMPEQLIPEGGDEPVGSRLQATDTPPEDLLHPAEAADISHNTGFAATVEDGQPGPGMEYRCQLDDGVWKQVLIEQVIRRERQGHSELIVRGSVQPET